MFFHLLFFFFLFVFVSFLLIILFSILSSFLCFSLAFPGSHIKGLFINLLHHFWPALLRTTSNESADNFLEEFVTPIVKVAKGKEKLEFFTVHEYDQWKQSIGEEIR